MAARPSALPEGYVRVQKHFRKPSMTRAADAGETDVNKIVARHAKTGVVSHLNNKPAMYGDLSQATDLHQALNLAAEAREAFASLPATVRRAADNDPRRMLEMLADPDLTAELVDAGLDLDLAPEARDPSPGSPALGPPSGGASAANTGGETPPQPAPTPARGAPEGGEQ